MTDKKSSRTRVYKFGIGTGTNYQTVNQLFYLSPIYISGFDNKSPYATCICAFYTALISGIGFYMINFWRLGNAS